jgi:hypothetical protein
MSKLGKISKNGKFNYLLGTVRDTAVKKLLGYGYIVQKSNGYSITKEGVVYLSKLENNNEFLKLEKAVMLEATMKDGNLVLNQTNVYVKSTNPTFTNFQNPVTGKGNRIKNEEYGTIHKSDFTELSPKVPKTGFYACGFFPISELESGIETLRNHIADSLVERVETIQNEVETLTELSESVNDGESYEVTIKEIPVVEVSENEDETNDENTDLGDLSEFESAPENEDSTDEKILDIKDDPDMAEFSHLF